jgi:hypothetical protein
MAGVSDQALVGVNEPFFPSINTRLIAAFTPIKKAVGVHSKHAINILPTRPIGVHDSEIQFESPSMGSAWMDLKNCDVHIKGSLRLADGSKFEAEEEAMLVRNSYCALFETVTLSVGRSFTEIQQINFSHTGLFKMFMENRQERMATASLSGASFQTNSTSATDYKNQKGRENKFAVSVPVEFISPTYISFFSTIGYVPPNTMLKVKYRRTPATFYTLAQGASAAKSFRFDIDEMFLRVPTVHVMPQIAPHLDQLRLDVNARLYYDDLVVKKLPIPSDSETRTFSNLFNGNLPKLLFISFFDEDNFVGRNNLDPFFTSSQNVKKLSVSMNGYTVKNYDMNMTGKLYGDAYKSFVEAIGASNSTFSITYGSWLLGNRFFACDFLNCESAAGGDNCTEETVLQGTMDVSVQFDVKTTKAQVMLVLALTTDSVELMPDGAAILNRIVV